MKNAKSQKRKTSKAKNRQRVLFWVPVMFLGVPFAPLIVAAAVWAWPIILPLLVLNYAWWTFGWCKDGTPFEIRLIWNYMAALLLLAPSIAMWRHPEWLIFQVTEKISDVILSLYTPFLQ